MKEQDSFRRFLFSEVGVRGEWVRLTNSFQAVIEKHQYLPVIQQQLGQALVAVTLLSATIKFTGSMILQAQGDGAIRTLVTQCTNDRHIRGIAKYSEQAVNDITGEALKNLFGQGRLVLTIEPIDADAYQGIVQLTGNNLAQAIENYFTQSEQLQTRLWIFANNNQAVGLLLQELPAKNNNKADWDRIVMLADTVTEEELMTLSSEEILYRLFNEDQVRVFDSEPVMFRCSCSTVKVENTLLSLGRNALEEILQEREDIIVDCEFCNQKYQYDRVDIERVLRGVEKPTQNISNNN